MPVMNIPDQIQIGYKLSKGETEMKLDPSVHPLAYCRRWGTGDSEKKLTESIKSWCGEWGAEVKPGSNWAPIILDNKPMKGFKFGESVSRWSTSNKFLEVLDPRGFKLQISIENLAILIGSATINSGTIETECVWAFDKSRLALLDINSEFYKEVLQANESQKKHYESLSPMTNENAVPGRIYKNKNGKEKWMYLGKVSMDRIVYDERSHFNTTSWTRFEFRKKVSPLVHERRNPIFQTSKALPLFIGIDEYPHPDNLQSLLKTYEKYEEKYSDLGSIVSKEDLSTGTIYAKFIFKKNFSGMYECPEDSCLLENKFSFNDIKEILSKRVAFDNSHLMYKDQYQIPLCVRKDVEENLLRYTKNYFYISDYTKIPDNEIWSNPEMSNPYYDDIKYTQIRYLEEGL